MKLLDGVDHAGITLVRRLRAGHRPERFESAAATGAVPTRFDALQHEQGEGPCFDASGFIRRCGSSM